MRSGRSFLFLLLTAAVLGGYIYFVELKREPTADTESTRTRVFTLEPGSIQEVELTNAAGDTTRVVKQDTTWQITAPDAAEADTVEVSQVVSSIETLEQSRVVAENASDLAPFGLAPARITLAFKAGDESRRLLIGNKTPTGGDMYAMVEGDSNVVLIPGYLEATFDKKPFDLREKSVLKFTRDAADAITIVDGASRLAFSKAGDTWRLSAPINAQADFATVDGLVSRLFQARMIGLVATDGTSTLRQYGLDTPQVVVTVGSGSARAELAIGGPEGETNVYARDLSRPMVFTIEKSLLDELRKKPEDVRAKDVFAFRSFNATRFVVTSDGVTYTFEKTKGEGENAADVWTLTAPTNKVADATKMTDLLTTTSNLRAEGFAATAFTAGATVTVTATFNDGDATTTEMATFRKSGSTVHAIREGEPGAAVVSTVDFDKVVSLLKDIAGGGK